MCRAGFSVGGMVKSDPPLAAVASGYIIRSQAAPVSAAVAAVPAIIHQAQIQR